MPFSLGSFLTAAGSAAAGGLQGDRDRRQREEEQRRYEEQRQRQAMQDRLMQELTQARITDLQRPPAPARPIAVGPYLNEQGQAVRGLQDPNTGQTIPGSEKRVPPPAPGYSLVQGASGEYVWVPRPGAGAPTPPTVGEAPSPVAAVPTGVVGKQPAPAETKPASRSERGDAAYAARAAIAAGTMDMIEMTNPRAVKEAALALNRPNFAKAIPFLGSRSEKAVKALREVGLSDDAVRYLNSLVEFASNAAPAQFTPGSLRSPEMLYNVWVEFGVQPGEPPDAWHIKQRNRKNLVRGAAFRAGPQAWEAALQAFPEVDQSWLQSDSTAFGGIDLQQIERYNK